MGAPGQSLTFLAWARPPLQDLVTAQAAGRAQASVSITLSESGGAGRSTTQALGFLVAGPADVAGLQPGAIVRRYPPPDALDHESDRCPYVELADPTLPWRYTPAPTPHDASLHPWLVLVVGLEGAELVLDRGLVTLATAVQQGVHALGAPASPYRFAHVQESGGQRTTRLLSARPLAAGTDYLAVVVPAFDANGAPSWDGSAPVTLPAYDVWRFQTAVPAGSFEDLAARLHPGDAPASTGHAALRYPRLAAAPPLSVAGALVARPSQAAGGEDPLPDAVRADLASLRLPARDPQGRPIVTLPRYGDAWDASAPDDATWGQDLNLDPRHRGVAGLGLAVAIERQEDLVQDLMENLGALHAARQRVRHLTLGVAATRALWQRRLPADPGERLALLGPALDRLVTGDGSLAQLATADERTLPRGAFSSAARRVLRAGPARTATAAAVPTPGAALVSANREPPPPPSGIDGVPLTATTLHSFDVARKTAVDQKKVSVTGLVAAASDMASAAAAPLRTQATQLATALREAAQAGKPVPLVAALASLASADATVVGRTRNPGAVTAVVGRGLTGLPGAPSAGAGADVVALLAGLSPLAPGDPALAPVDLGSLGQGVSAALDPTVALPPAAQRVLGTISGGIDPAQPLAPPEPCLGLDRPAWADLAATFPEWLLPGLADLPEEAVIALETDAIFLDAYLTGLNTQLLSELRWRNVPVATGCTPLRRFWSRSDPATGEPAADVTGIASWSAQSTLGDQQHRAPGVTGHELVIALRGELLRRYPATIVYLRSAVPPGATAPDFDHDPDASAPPVFPGFRGTLADDVTFFGFPGMDESALSTSWLVLEEPPAGYRFANDVATGALAGHDWAAATLAQPVRVLIRGDSLLAGGSP